MAGVTIRALVLSWGEVPMRPPTATVDKGAAKLVYEESKTSAADLDADLKSFRANATAVLALVTGAAAFLSFSDTAKGPWFLAASITYVAVVILVASIYWPVGWNTNVARAAPEALVGPNSSALTETKALVDLARAHQAAWEKNSATISGKWGIAERFVGLVIVSTAVIAMMLANTTVEKPDPPEKPTLIQIVEE